jgi:hypothetical protein
MTTPTGKSARVEHDDRVQQVTKAGGQGGGAGGTPAPPGMLQLRCPQESEFLPRSGLSPISERRRWSCGPGAARPVREYVPHRVT